MQIDGHETTLGHAAELIRQELAGVGTLASNLAEETPMPFPSASATSSPLLLARPFETLRQEHEDMEAQIRRVEDELTASKERCARLESQLQGLQNEEDGLFTRLARFRMATQDLESLKVMSSCPPRHIRA